MVEKNWSSIVVSSHSLGFCVCVMVWVAVSVPRGKAVKHFSRAASKCGLCICGSSVSWQFGLVSVGCQET